jgi:uncharacterized membrane protein
MSFMDRLRASSNRANAANVLMVSFIIFTSIGAWMIRPSVGLIVAGVSCGVFGFLLGLE